MKIKVVSKKVEAPKSFSKGQLLESDRGGIYICVKSHPDNAVDVTVINPENPFEEPGKLMFGCYTHVFKLFTGEITLSND